MEGGEKIQGRVETKGGGMETMSTQRSEEIMRTLAASLEGQETQRPEN